MDKKYIANIASETGKEKKESGLVWRIKRNRLYIIGF